MSEHTDKSTDDDERTEEEEEELRETYHEFRSALELLKRGSR